MVLAARVLSCELVAKPGFMRQTTPRIMPCMSRSANDGLLGRKACPWCPEVQTKSCSIMQLLGFIHASFMVFYETGRMKQDGTCLHSTSHPWKTGSSKMLRTSSNHPPRGGNSLNNEISSQPPKSSTNVFNHRKATEDLKSVPPKSIAPKRKNTQNNYT